MGLNKALMASFLSGGGDVPFEPITTLSTNPFFYGDPDDTTTIFSDTAGTTEATSTVARINSLTGDDRPTLQSSGSLQPDINSRTENGKRLLNFSNTSKRMQFDSSLYNLPNGANTLMIAVKADVANFMWMIRGLTSGSSRYGLRYQSGSDGDSVASNGTGYIGLIGDVVGTELHILLMRRAGPQIEISLDGTSFFDVAYDRAVDAILDDLRFGDNFDGAVGRHAAWDRYITNTELNAIGQEWAEFYDTTWVDFEEYGSEIVFDNGTNITYDNGVPVEWDAT